MRICVDLDGTICELRKEGELYGQLKPKEGAIDKLQKLHDAGHYIIIYTSRRMKTHDGNVAKVIADVGKITLDWLERYGVPFDEIAFGKPWADIYIDDNALRFVGWGTVSDDGQNLPQSNESKLKKNA